MPNIRPISDLRNNFAEITREVQATDEPVFLTKNGVGAIVVMSMDSYEARRYESGVYAKLREAEMEAVAGGETYNREEVMDALRAKVRRVMEKSDGV